MSMWVALGIGIVSTFAAGMVIGYRLGHDEGLNDCMRMMDEAGFPP